LYFPHLVGGNVDVLVVPGTEGFLKPMVAPDQPRGHFVFSLGLGEPVVQVPAAQKWTASSEARRPCAYDRLRGPAITDIKPAQV
jgi:hypothetical protein